MTSRVMSWATIKCSGHITEKKPNVICCNRSCANCKGTAAATAAWKAAVRILKTSFRMTLMPMCMNPLKA